MPEQAFDVAICGAGPAGSTLAQRLAREGFRVVLVESQRFPRHKPCGEFMSPEVLPMLDDLGVLDEVRAVGARELRGLRIHRGVRRARGRFTAVGRSRPRFDHGFGVRREVFDHVLLRAALRTGGVTLLEGWRAARLLRAPDGAVLGFEVRRSRGESYEVRARFTVGADGLRSRVAGELGVRRARTWLDRLALVTRYRGAALDDEAEAYLLDDGFFAAAPVDGGLLSLNLVVDRSAYVAAGLGPEAYLLHRLAWLPQLRERLETAERVDPVRGIGPLSTSTVRQVADGAALVGDACGYVDPITGEGIFLALRGAELLATALARALHAGRRDAAALQPYVRARRSELWPRELFGLALQRGLRHPRLVELALGQLAAHPPLCDLLVSLTGDYAPLSELLRPATWKRAFARPVTP
jgi:flavin-dependent dehydrogenase